MRSYVQVKPGKYVLYTGQGRDDPRVVQRRQEIVFSECFGYVKPIHRMTRQEFLKKKRANDRAIRKEETFSHERPSYFRKLTNGRYPYL